MIVARIERHPFGRELVIAFEDGDDVIETQLDQAGVMFETDDPEALRSFTQQDLLASAIRMSLGLMGPMGSILGEFLTEFVPRQRMDRLQDFVEKLNERIVGCEQQFKDRTASSPGFAALTEQATLSAVRSASSDHRTDLAEILKHGLSRGEADMIAAQHLLTLRERINDAQVLILMSYGNFRRTVGDDQLSAFYDAHPDVFKVRPATHGSSEDDTERWTIVEHYTEDLVSLRLLEIHESSLPRQQNPHRYYELSMLGRSLLKSVGRYRDL